MNEKNPQVFTLLNILLIGALPTNFVNDERYLYMSTLYTIRFYSMILLREWKIKSL